MSGNGYNGSNVPAYNGSQNNQGYNGGYNGGYNNGYNNGNRGFNNGGFNNGHEPGKGLAIASLVMGILSLLTWFLGTGAFIGMIFGIVGIVCASSSKRAGYYGGLQTAGFVCSLIGLIVSSMVFVACVACMGALGTIGAMSS